MNNRRMWAGVAAGVLAAMVLVGVAAGAYQAGQRHEVVTQVVGDGGEVVRVVGDRGWHHGPGPGFFLFPLLGIVLVVMLLKGRGGPGGGWNRGCGPGGSYGGPEAAIHDWHRRAHGDAGAPSASEPSTVSREA